MAGSIIILNGTSSSGKSSISAELLQLFPEAKACWMSHDQFTEDYIRSLGKRTTLFKEYDPTKPVPGGKRFLPHLKTLFYHTVQALSELGQAVIVDVVLSDKKQVLELAAVLEGHRVLLVGVHCPVEELRRRENERGDRRKGMAEYQLGFIHKDLIYDMELQSFPAGPKECAEEIKAFYDKVPEGNALQSMLQTQGADYGIREDC
jgi:chloramphenicol 3-O phosphotransferase